MCFIKNSEFELKVAAADILVIKVVSVDYDNSTMYVPFYKIDSGMRYCINQTPESPLIVEEHDHQTKVNIALHSYLPEALTFRCNSSRRVVGKYEIWSTNQRMPLISFWESDIHDSRILICTIPKGAVYETNEKGEVVSNMLVPIECITLDEAFEKPNRTIGVLEKIKAFFA